MNERAILSSMFLEKSDNATSNNFLLDENVINFFNNNRFLWFYCDMIKQVDTGKLPPLAVKLIKIDYIKKKQQKARMHELKKICTYLQEHNIEYLIVKGPVLSEQIYGDVTHRYYNDIDILLPNFYKDILEVLVFFKEHSYNQELGWNNRQEINVQNFIVSERFDHHEIVCSKGFNNIYKFELKNALSAIPAEIIGVFLKNIASYNIEGIMIKSFDLLYSFLVLCSNTFVNSESRSAIVYNKSYIRHYYDVYMFIKKHSKVLDPFDINKVSEELFLHLRVSRVISNLLQLLTYDKKICVGNKDIIMWCEKLLCCRGGSNISTKFHIACDDIFLDGIPSEHEIIDWNTSFIDRIFSNNRNHMIQCYKKSIVCNQLEDFTNKNKCGISTGISIIKKITKFYLTIEQQLLSSNSYKIEFLACLECDEMFNGFIISKESVNNGKTPIFISNAKHYEEITDDTISIQKNSNYIICDMTNLICKSIYENNKIIFRISKVQPILNDMYQELDSASYKYFVG